MTKQHISLTKSVWFDGENVHDGLWILQGADPDTIREFGGGRFISDKRHVWHFGRVISEADGSTFVAIGGIDGIYAKDKNLVYHENRGGYIPIDGADPKTFEALDFAYARDSKGFYCSGERLEDIGSYFSIDQCGFLIGEHAVYHYNYRLPLDPGSFRVVNLKEKLKEINPFLGNFELADKDGNYSFVNDGFSATFSPKLS